MLKLAALAFPPIAAVLFGVLFVGILVVRGPGGDFDLGAALYFSAAAASILLSMPLSWLVARRMLTGRERRFLEAHTGRGR